MKEYNKSSKLQHVAYDIRGPVLEEPCMRKWRKIHRLNTESLLNLALLCSR